MSNCGREGHFKRDFIYFKKALEYSSKPTQRKRIMQTVKLKQTENSNVSFMLEAQQCEPEMKLYLL